jgi:hypothetical protein
MHKTASSALIASCALAAGLATGPCGTGGRPEYGQSPHRGHFSSPFASAHPERTSGLVCLDAAYDHVEALQKEQEQIPFL